MSDVVLMKENVEAELERLETYCYSLECSDDRLFTNGNANLEQYQEAQSKIKQLRKLLENDAIIR